MKSSLVQPINTFITCTRAISKVAALTFISGFLIQGSLCMADNQPSSGVNSRPSWCQSGYICLPTKDAADLLIKVDYLQSQVDILKAKRLSRLGYAAVCGPSASLQVDNGNTTLAGTLSCTIGVGWRF